MGTPVVRQTVPDGSAPPLVGRNALVESLDACVAGNGSAVLTGPSGIGKTALLETVSARAAARGELVLRVAGSETERWIPYGVAGEFVDQIPAQRLDELPEQRRLVLAGEPPTSRRPADEEARAAWCRAWRDLLARCAEHTPVLLLVDDAQWLDTDTVDVVRSAVRRLRSRGVRAVIAGCWPDGLACEDGGNAPWSPVPDAQQFPVPPLAQTELAELFESYGLPVRVVNKLHADSGGNPFLALALGGAFTERLPHHWRPAPLPQRVQAVITERLARLSPQVRETLLTAALASRPTTDLLRRAGRAEAARDVGQAAAAGLLITEGGGIRFTPPAVGTVLAEHADAAHRAAVHTALVAVVPDAAGRARHRALAVSGPDVELAHSLVTAAEAAARQGSYRMAAELYLLAADRSPSEPAAERMEWLVAAAESGAAWGMPDLVHRAADAVLAGDATKAQRVRVRLALLDLSGQGIGEMDDLFAAALVDADGDPALLGPLRLRMAGAAAVNGEPERGDLEAGRAIEHARAIGDTALEGKALVQKTNTAVLRGDTGYRRYLDRALRLPEPPLDGQIHATPRFLEATCAVYEDRLDAARDDLLRMLALVERGSGEEVVHVLRKLAEACARLGRCQDALHFADRAIRVTEEASLSPGPAWTAGAIAELAGGSLSRAVGYAERGAQASAQEGDMVFHAVLLHVLGVARIRSGDVRGGVQAMLRIDELGESCRYRSPLVLRRHGDLAAAWAALGEPERAREVIGAVRPRLTDTGHGGGVTAQLDRAEAAACAAEGRPDEALALLCAAADRFGALGQPLEVGHCLLEQARVERRRRRFARAHAVTAEALEIFTRCGARPWAEQARHSLSQLETGAADGRAPAAAGAAANEAVRLTENEERIAVLVTEGATNQQVADRLFMSVKTIEAALTRVYRKLGIRSRAQLGARLRNVLNGPEGAQG
ncbi:MAG TPA: AAA family ATPase [Streptomyces sp.]|jgi:DNA-binding CsgD family transcriptional regulator|nr:AAA family ATPase [Streptomyces sp.]